jgi:DUF2075 family protein
MTIKAKIIPREKEILYKDISEFSDGVLLINTSNTVGIKNGEFFTYISCNSINTCLTEDVCGLYKIFEDAIILENKGFSI